MKLIAQVRLYPTEEQAAYLLQTLETANLACNQISAYAWEQKIFGQFALHKAQYHTIRGSTGLSAQIIVRAIAKVANAYKLDKKTARTFKPRGAIAYDDRILRWLTERREVSIWSIAHRLQIPYKASERQHELLAYRQGEADLVYRRDKWYLLQVCDIPDPDERDVDTALGVDLGVVNIATTSDNDIYTSEIVEKNRQRMNRLRRDLQKRGTPSAKRHLKKLAGKQRRFQSDVNHTISKRIVQQAKRTNALIGVEDLTHINGRTRVKGKEQRARRSNWAFAQLRQYILYKSSLAGVPLVLVDPHYTSQRCFACGHIERANRPTQAQFCCVQCGHTIRADVNAAQNIAFLAWASFNTPIVGTSVTDNLPTLAG